MSTDVLAPIADKLKRFIRLLSSDSDGEVVAAARALSRTLKAAGADIHVLADCFEQVDAKLSEAEMRKIYDAGHDAGYAAGVRAAEAKLQHDADGFRSVDGIPASHAMAIFCQDRSTRLRSNEADFIDDMVGWTTWREPTPKQQKWLRSIYARLGGRLPP